MATPGVGYIQYIPPVRLTTQGREGAEQPELPGYNSEKRRRSEATCLTRGRVGALRGRHTATT
eukprot:3401601-Prymnesium_polylepis.1